MKKYQIGEQLKYRNTQDCEFWGYAKDDLSSAYIHISGSGAWYVSTKSLQRKKGQAQ